MVSKEKRLVCVLGKQKENKNHSINMYCSNHCYNHAKI